MRRINYKRIVNEAFYFNVPFEFSRRAREQLMTSPSAVRFQPFTTVRSVVNNTSSRRPSGQTGFPSATSQGKDVGSVAVVVVVEAPVGDHDGGGDVGVHDRPEEQQNTEVRREKRGQTAELSQIA